MKTYKHLYLQVYDFENLYLAYRKARIGKRGRAQPAYCTLNNTFPSPHNSSRS